MGKLARIDTFTTKAGKQILTLIFYQDGQWPQWIPVKVFGRMAEMASEWNVGDILEITGDLGGREWNGKVFGDITARTVEVVSHGGGQHCEERASNEAHGWGESVANDAPGGSDDIPF
jgi:single-stranded DNA-binding protein